MSFKRRGSTLKQLAAELGVPVSEALERLQRSGISPPPPRKRVAGRKLRELRAAPGLAARQRSAGASTHLDGLEPDWRLLPPLLRKGKTSRDRTTPTDNAFGHGVPDHQAGAAKGRVDQLIRDGLIATKVSQGRQHVWLTPAGRAAVEAIRAHGGRTPAGRLPEASEQSKPRE